MIFTSLVSETIDGTVFIIDSVTEINLMCSFFCCQKSSKIEERIF